MGSLACQKEVPQLSHQIQIAFKKGKRATIIHRAIADTEKHCLSNAH